jgi:CO/xanthine dehydrogenase FAD-binding subunit
LPEFEQPQSTGEQFCARDRYALGDAFRRRKASRVKPKGAAVVSIAAHLPNLGGRVSNARVAYGAMAPTAVRAKGVERALQSSAST